MSALQQINGRRTSSNPLVPSATDAPAVSNVAAARKRALRRMAIGLVFFIAGLAITAATYSHAASSPSGGTYIVAWGPMVFGVLSIVRGMVALRRANNL